MRHYFEQYTNYRITIRIKHNYVMTEIDLKISNTYFAKLFHKPIAVKKILDLNKSENKYLHNNSIIME